MKLLLFLAISCLALHNGKGAPRTAVYRFVRCNPEGDQANCVTQQSPEMPWSPDLPAKLPASTAQYLEAEPVEEEPVEEESPMEEEEDEAENYKEDDYEEEEEEEEEEYSQPASEDQTPELMPEEGSGIFEGSAAGELVPHHASMSETGSGESWTEEEVKPFKGGQGESTMKRLFPSRSLLNDAKPAEQDLKEDHLLKL